MADREKVERERREHWKIEQTETLRWPPTLKTAANHVAIELEKANRSTVGLTSREAGQLAKELRAALGAES